MKIQDIIIWTLVVVSIMMALWYLFGNSPTFEQAILVFVLTLLFTIHTKISNIATKMDYLEKRFFKIEESFIKLTKDFKEHIKHK